MGFSELWLMQLAQEISGTNIFTVYQCRDI